MSPCLHTAIGGASLFVAVITATPARADPLTFDAAIARARANAPSLKAQALGTDASRARRDAAGQLPDPKLSLGIDSFPISGPLAFQPSRDNFTWVRVGLSQEIPNLAKRHARQARADSDIMAAEADTLAEARTVEADTAVAWIGLAYADKRLAALDGLSTRLDRLVRTTPSAVASGAARPAQTLAGRQALATLADRRDDLVAAVVRARAVLAKWTGDRSPTIAGPVPNFPIDGAPLHDAVETNPILAPAAGRVGQADAEVRLAEAERRPDFGVEVAYQRRDPRFGDYVSAGVTIGLPLFKKHRQEPLIAARRAEAGKFRAEQEAARRELTAKLDADLGDHAMHLKQWIRSTDTLEPLARERADLETASYGAGRASLVDVVDAHTALVDATLTTLDREALVAADSARIALTYGSAVR